MTIFFVVVAIFDAIQLVFCQLAPLHIYIQISLGDTKKYVERILVCKGNSIYVMSKMRYGVLEDVGFG